MQRTGRPVIAVVGVVVALAICGGLVFFARGLGNREAALDFQQFTQDSLAISHPDGLEISVVPNLLREDFAVALTSISRGEFHGANTGEAWVPLRDALPTYLNLADFAFSIDTQGTAPTEISIAARVPEGTIPSTLDLYGWDGEVWYFIPSHMDGDQATATVETLPRAVALMQTAPVVPVTAAVFNVGDVLGDFGSALNIVEPSGLFLQADGSLAGEVAGGWVFGAGYGVMPIVTNGDKSDGQAALNDLLAVPDARVTNIGSLVDLSVNGGYNGVVLDYRGLDPARGPAFTLFVETLAAALHAENKSLTVVIAPPGLTEAGLDTGGYDLASLGAVVDALEIRMGDDPTVYGNGYAQAILEQVVEYVSRYKVRMSASSSSTSLTNNVYLPVTTREALAPLGGASLASDPTGLVVGQAVTVALDGTATLLGYDENAFTPKYEFVDEAGVNHTMFLATPGMLANRLAVAQRLYLGGVTILDLFAADGPAGMLDGLVQYKVNAFSVAAVTNPAVVWTISDGGSVVAQGAGSPEEPFTWTAALPGEYSVAATLRLNADSPLSGFNLAIAEVESTPAPTATPTFAPLPTATPCTGECPTAAPAPPTATPQPTAAAAIAPGVFGPFELGGQVVHGGIAAANEMKQAGMTWVKLQAHYPADLTADINNAHNLGFKILLSAIGDRARAHDPAHQAEYAAWLGTLAANGADAIEVWNEMNLTREWPDGQIGPNSYLPMLQQAYNAIKGANPGTLVISGALAPTGFFNGCHPNGCDDKPYLEGLVAAGGANYLDCVGIHYNEGVVPPSAFGGGVDPRDDHYTRYFYGMVETYSAIFGGNRQMCFTELGYLSGEEWGSLPAAFTWKPPYNNTVAEQAQYLAEAAGIAQSDGRIRMIIVFNVDFTQFGDDPQAGYAMIRPNGQCPACAALDAVMP